MKWGLPTALAVASALNLLAGLPAASEPSSQPSATPEAVDANGQQPAGGRAVSSPVIGTGKPEPTAESKSKEPRKARKTQAKAAGAGSVTIKDFSFGPSSVTVHVGDTVSWSNNGRSDHTATARNGSFDTGTLKQGQSGSHTFTQAGTISYFCSIHPFMHGTVVVAAAGGGSSGSSGKSSGSPASPSAGSPSAGGATSSSQQGLPNSGVDVGTLVLSGGLLLGSGLLLRRRAA
jgi:plastocyanin